MAVARPRSTRRAPGTGSERARRFHLPAGAARSARGSKARTGLMPAFVDEAKVQTASHFPGSPGDRPSLHVRLFGSHEFFRLWLVQVVSATGDWLGLTATIAFASQLFPAEPGASAAAISLVLTVRLLPHVFFAPVAGVLVDRLNRKKLMMACDLSRAGLLCLLPFLKSLWGLVLISFLLEIFTLIWSPAKEAVTPDLVPHDHLTTANSLNLAAAYGTAPLATLIFTALAGISAWLGSIGSVSFLGLNQTALAFYADAATFAFAAVMVLRLPIPKPLPRHPDLAGGAAAGDARETARPAGTIRELKEGWRYVFLNDRVRAVSLGMACALIGGGMLIPLGAVFSADVLGAGAAGFGLFTTALMFGVALGVIAVSALQRRLDPMRAFPRALTVAGIALLGAASVSSLGLSAILVFVLGAAVGPVYVLGFSILHSEVDDDMRGRVFSAFNTLVRFCVLVSIWVGPLLAASFDQLSRLVAGDDRSVPVGAASFFVPGVRITLWLDAAIVVVAGLVARHAAIIGRREQERSVAGHPANRRPAPIGGNE